MLCQNLSRTLYGTVQSYSKRCNSYIGCLAETSVMHAVLAELHRPLSSLQHLHTNIQEVTDRVGNS